MNLVSSASYWPLLLPDQTLDDLFNLQQTASNLLLSKLVDPVEAPKIQTP